MQRNNTLVVIGGGAAGFFCAVNAARLNPLLHVILLEKTGKFLSKVKVSGGGRCNVTHACFEIPELIKKYPRGENFLKKAFHGFSPADTIAWFGEHGVKLKTEEDGRMFPVTNSSQTIIDCLVNEADKYHVERRLHAEVKEVTDYLAVEGKKQFLLNTSDGFIPADFLCIASGGYPKPEQFSWIGNLGHTIQTPVPSLFTFNLPGNRITSLMGVSVTDASIKIDGTKLAETGPVLITHWGLSGPAVLKLSAWGANFLKEKEYHFRIRVNWLCAFTRDHLKSAFAEKRMDEGAQKINQRNSFGLPKRLWEFLVQAAGIKPETRWADVKSQQENILLSLLSGQEFEVKGKTTYKEEFVTAGGISLAEVDANKMQSRKNPNLFFAGEVLDVDGITGGFNFQHAWTSGFIAAKTIAELSL